MAQRDKGGSPDAFETSLPPAQSGEDVPSWLVALGAIAGVALLIALLRYAIDLLGVVFVIILVGFAIRTVSDWLTEGESVSAWAMSAMSLGLIGTLVVALWLFNSGSLTQSSVPLPGPVQKMVSWLESKGWGQRVLLSSGSGGSAIAGGGAMLPAAGGAPSSPAPMAPAASGPASSSASAAASPGGRSARPARKPSETAEPAAGTPPLPAPVPPARLPTQTTLTISPSPVVVGRSVRLTANVRGDATAAGPTGAVVFQAGPSILGRVPVRHGTAVLVTLSLAIGDHTLTAAYDGDAHYLPSQSDPVAQTVIRQ